MLRAGTVRRLLPSRVSHLVWDVSEAAFSWNCSVKHLHTLRVRVWDKVQKVYIEILKP